MTITERVHEVDFYQILNLPFNSSNSSTATLSKQQIKVAYHKALLKHHPDKVGAVAQAQSPNGSHAMGDRFLARAADDSTQQWTYTVDEITSAYKTLSDPQLRAEYDRKLRLDRSKASKREKNGVVFHTGLEIVDLEDLAYDDGEDGAEGPVCWYRGCRCGDARGFLVTEDDLEKEAEHGEIVVGCRGCSLWLKVLFAVEDEG